MTRFVILVCFQVICLHLTEAVPVGNEAPTLSPCAAVFCAYNTTCIDETPKNCEKPPCSKTARCVPIPQSQPSCDTMTCPEGQKCVLHQVQCFRAPCPPQPMCEKTKTKRGITCANVRCAGGPCVMENVCEKKDGHSTCSERPVCKPASTTGQPKFTPCMAMKCTRTTTCVEEKSKDCSPSSPDCPLVGRCAPNSPKTSTSTPPTCDGFVCPTGEKCELLQVHCKKAPCPPYPGCISS